MQCGRTEKMCEYSVEGKLIMNNTNSINRKGKLLAVIFYPGVVVYHIRLWSRELWATYGGL